MADSTAPERPNPGGTQPATVDDAPHPDGQPIEGRPGGVIGDYEVLDEIARGGMGVVYRARDRRSGLLVALKMMLAVGDQSNERRFVLEARALGELTHPGVVTIHHWGEHDGHPFYTMDFVPGVPLSKLLEKGPLPPEHAVRYLGGIGRAVAAAHAHGIVHRDLKPGNVIIDLADQPRVLDFGLAKRHGRAAGPKTAEDVLEVIPADRPTPVTTPPAAHRTEQGAILGTPAYMAPEQVRAAHDEVGPPADVHALGAIFYEMLAGRPPFVGEQTYDTLMQVVREQAPPLRSINQNVPRELEVICRRCLEKEARRRYPDAGVLVTDLERRWRRRTQGQRFARLTLLALVIVLLFQLVRWLVDGVNALDPSWLADRAATSSRAAPPLHQALVAVGFLIELVVLSLTPMLAAIAGAVWAGTWVWYSNRAGLLTLLWCLTAAAGVLLWSMGGVAGGLFGPTVLIWLLLGNATAAVVALVRRKAEALELAEATAPQAEPYLRRLYARRVEARPKAAARAVTQPQPGLADFELGKTLHAGEGCTARWARQMSLDRPVLVWFTTTGKGPVPGVVVRHPDVLGLHAVGSYPAGLYLVTEGVAATPLAGLLDQKPLTVQEATVLLGRLARAVQAFHDHGACHGRLSADWILVHGDLEPLLCPCGAPMASDEDRARDVRDLGWLLRTWLHQRPGRTLTLERVCDAAEAGAYARPADLADDLTRAVQVNRVRQRESWAQVAGVLLLIGPLIWPAVEGIKQLATEEPAPVAWALMVSALVALALGGALAAFTFVRGLVQRWRLGWRPGASDVVLRWASPVRLVPAVLVVGLFGTVLACDWTAGRSIAQVSLSGLLLAGQFLGCWLLGVWVAGLVTFVELLWRSLRAESG